MNLFLQLLGNGIVQGAVAMLYAAGFGMDHQKDGGWPFKAI